GRRTIADQRNPLALPSRGRRVDWRGRRCRRNTRPIRGTVFARWLDRQRIRTELWPAGDATRESRVGPHCAACWSKLDCRDWLNGVGRVIHSTSRSGVVLLWLVVLSAILVESGSARAHLASDSYLRIEIPADGRVHGQWDIALRDLDVTI